MTCRCGRPSCRGMVTRFDSRKPKIQAKYAGYFSWFIQHRLLRDQQLPPGVDPPHPMSVPFIQATVFDNSALLRVNRNILPGYCHCRHSSANGCSAAIGRRAFVGAPAGPGEWRRLYRSGWAPF